MTGKLILITLFFLIMYMMPESRHSADLRMFTLFVCSLHFLASCELHISDSSLDRFYSFCLCAITSIISMRNYCTQRKPPLRWYEMNPLISLLEFFKYNGHLIFWGLAIIAELLAEEHSRMCMLLCQIYCIFYISSWLCKKIGCFPVLVYSLLLYCTYYYSEKIVLILALHMWTAPWRRSWPVGFVTDDCKKKIEKERLGFFCYATLLMYVSYFRGRNATSETEQILKMMEGQIDIIIVLFGFFKLANFEIKNNKVEWNCIHVILLGFISVLYFVM